MMSDKLTINLKAIVPGQELHPLRIHPAEEPVVREAAEFVRGKFSQYRQRFEELSDLDIMTMIALHVAKNGLTLEKEYEPLKEKIAQMNEALKKYLTRNR